MGRRDVKSVVPRLTEAGHGLALDVRFAVGGVVSCDMEGLLFTGADGVMVVSGSRLDVIA